MKKKAFKAALPHTLPICVGFLFLGMSYGFMMRSKGFSFVYPLFMSMFIFAGSMEFVTANLLLSASFWQQLFYYSGYGFHYCLCCSRYNGDSFPAFYYFPRRKRATGIYQLSWQSASLCSNRTSCSLLSERCAGKRDLCASGSNCNFVHCSFT